MAMAMTTKMARLVGLPLRCRSLILPFAKSPNLQVSLLVSASARPISLSFVGGDEPDACSTAATRRFSPLTPKEKKELRSYANSLGKSIVSQQIGKAGVTESLAKSISDVLEAKEILKVKVLDNCPDELEEVIRKIEVATKGQVVGKIGSVLTIYRPSLRKLSSVQKQQTKNPDRVRRK